MLSIYAPCLRSSPETSDEFYEALDAAIANGLCAAHLCLLGDITLRVRDDHESWPKCLDSFGTRNTNTPGIMRLPQALRGQHILQCYPSPLTTMEVPKVIPLSSIGIIHHNRDILAHVGVAVWTAIQTAA